jgi:membrane-associated PAP2 superfamily phosphatase
VRHLALPLYALACAAFLFETTDWDLRTCGPFWNPESGGWVGEDAFWANGLLHDGGKWAIVAWASSALILFLASLRSRRLARWKWPALYLLLCTGLGTGAVGILKATTGRHCPREMSAFGGTVPYTTLFDGLPPNTPRGNCFPSGHASGPLSLLGLYFVARARRVRRPVLWLLPGLVLGSLYALGQHARGAHFLSHDLWAAAVCWLVALGLASAFGEDRLASREPGGSPAWAPASSPDSDTVGETGLGWARPPAD